MAKVDLDANLDDLSDHDLLIVVATRQKRIEKCLENHLAHHWAFSIGIFLAVAGAIAALVCKLLFR